MGSASLRAKTLGEVLKKTWDRVSLKERDFKE
jgi:hypothetical protein